MTEKEMIDYIAWNWEKNAAEIGREIGVRASSVAEFEEKHKDEIMAAIIAHTEEAQAAQERAKREEMPEGLTQTRLGADVTRMCELCEAFSRYARENLYPPVEWVDEIVERATDVARGLREEMNMRDA